MRRKLNNIGVECSFAVEENAVIYILLCWQCERYLFSSDFVLGAFSYVRMCAPSNFFESKCTIQWRMNGCFFFLLCTESKLPLGGRSPILGCPSTYSRSALSILLKFGALIYRNEAVCEMRVLRSQNEMDGWHTVRLSVRLLLYDEIDNFTFAYGWNAICFRLDKKVSISMFFFFSWAVRIHVSRIFDLILPSTQEYFYSCFLCICTISQCKPKK